MWGTRVEELQATRPDLFVRGAIFCREWQIADAIADDQLDRRPALAAALAEIVVDGLACYVRSHGRLAYYGHLALLADTMARAWPLVRTSNTLNPDDVIEFGAQAQQLTLPVCLERAAAPRADDPDLLAAIRQFGRMDFPKALADQIALITGQADRPWDRAGDPELMRINRLGFRFQGELVRRWGMPLGRAELARLNLVTAIISRQLSKSPGIRTERRPRDKQKPPQSTAADLLFIDRERLYDYLTQLLGFTAFQPIVAAVILETVPAWLHFLHDQGLMSAEQRAEALRDIGTIVPQAEPILARYPFDPALVPNILAAWERATADSSSLGGDRSV